MNIVQRLPKGFASRFPDGTAEVAAVFKTVSIKVELGCLCPVLPQKPLRYVYMEELLASLTPDENDHSLKGDGYYFPNFNFSLTVLR